jgi:integrase
VLSPEERATLRRLLARLDDSDAPPASPTVADLWREYEAAKRAALAASWHVAVALMRPILAHLGERPAASLTRADVQSYLDARLRERTIRGAPPAPRTINAEMGRLLAVLNWAVDAERIAANPIRRRPKLRVSKVPRPDWGDAELALILDAVVMDWFRTVVIVRWYTGMRPTEALRLRWAQVDLDGAAVRLRAADTKTGQPRTVALPARAVEALREWRTIAPPSLYCFPSSRTGGPYTRQVAWLLWRQAVERAHIERDGERVTFHSVRGIWNSLARRAGVDLAVRCAQLGHASLSAHNDYEDVGERELHDAARLMDAPRLPPKSAPPTGAATRRRNRQAP